MSDVFRLIDGKGEAGHHDQSIAALAARQHGVVARRQLLRLGLGSDAIQHRLDAGRLHRIHRGVYSVGHRLLSRRGGWMAAILAAGDGAVLSHRSAAALWDLRRGGSGPIHLTRAGRGGQRRRRGLRIHRSETLIEEDRAVIDRIPVTSLPRTLVDLAGLLDPEQLAVALDEAERTRELRLAALRAACERNRGRRGVATLLSQAARLAPVGDTHRGLETSFARFCREQGIPPASTNVLVVGHLVDALWPRERLVVELDSWEFHGDRAAFERDRARDADLQRAGYRILRVTWRRLHENPCDVAATIRALLVTRPATFSAS